MTMILSKSGGNKYNKVATVWAGTSWLASTAVHSSQWYYLLIFQSSTTLNQLIMNYSMVSGNNNINII